MIKILAIDEAELTAQVTSMIRLKKSENKVLLKNERLEERKQAEEAIGRKCWELYRDNKTQCSDCTLI